MALEKIEHNPMQSLHWQKGLVAIAKTKRCGAKCRTRNYEPCKSPAMKNGRCRMHGGESPGASVGKKHSKYEHGLYAKETKTNNEYFDNQLKLAKELIPKVVIKQ